MKKLRLTKMIVSTLIVASIFALNPIGANAEWKQDSTGWWNTEGNSWSIGWRLIDRNWYYFYSNGYMAHNTTIDGYTLNSNGAWSLTQENEPKVEESNDSGNWDLSDYEIKVTSTSHDSESSINAQKVN